MSAYNNGSRRNITIIHGPQASGKSRRAQEFMRLYGCTRLVEEWDGKQPLRDGDLALTQMEPPFIADVSGAQIMPITRAKGILEEHKRSINNG